MGAKGGGGGTERERERETDKGVIYYRRGGKNSSE